MSRASMVRLLTLGLLLAARPWSVAAQAPVELQAAVREVCRSRAGATVAIARLRGETGVLTADPFEPFPIRRSRLPTADFVPNDFGAGVLVRASERDRPRVLTNYHVVRGGPAAGGGEGRFRLIVTLSTRHQFPATIVAADPRSDLAVLEIETSALPETLPVVTLGEPVESERGDFVVAFGNPYAIARDGSPSASFAMVSNLGRRPMPAGPPLEEETRRKETIHHFGTLMHLDGRLDIGTSGGPVFGLDGTFLGITTSLAALEGYEKSAGYAVPMDAVTRRAVDDLLQGYEVEYGFLGVEPLDFDQDEMAALPATIAQASAARVGRVFHNSPANRGLTTAGGLFPNDVVLGVRAVSENPTGLVRVYDKQDLIREVGKLPPDAQVELDVYRTHDRRRIVVRVRLGKWPVENDAEIVATHTRYPDWRGLRVDYPTGRRRYFGKPYVFHDAVLVTRVDPTANVSVRADAADLRPGSFVTHVNGQRVSSPREFDRVTRTITGPATLRTLEGAEYEVR